MIQIVIISCHISGQVILMKASGAFESCLQQLHCIAILQSICHKVGGSPLFVFS
jgi:hypothetical protein